MIVLLVLLQEAGTREVPYTDRAIEVVVPVAGDGKHRATVVSFPEEALEALVVGWNEEDLSVERRRDRLFLKLLRRSEGDLHVVGASGTLYRLFIRPAEREWDGHVRISRLESKKKKKDSTAFDLIRGMRSRRLLDGTQVRKASALLYGDSQSIWTVRIVYDAPSYRGYVLEVENLGKEPLRVEPQKLSGEGLELVGTRQMVIDPNRSTWVYLVYRR